jgi:hypothetical protein
MAMPKKVVISPFRGTLHRTEAPDDYASERRPDKRFASIK